LTLLNNQQHSANYAHAKEAEILINKTFFVQSNPHSNQKHRNFTDRCAVIFCFINENGRWPKLSEMFEVTNKDQKTVGTAPLDREASDRV
jgi:hypothetical protein